MRYVMQKRITHTEPITYKTPHFDIGTSLFRSFDIIADAVSGAGTSVEGIVETSDDLKYWVQVASRISTTSVGFTLGAADPNTDPHRRYARVEGTVRGRGLTATYSVALDTAPSSWHGSEMKEVLMGKPGSACSTAGRFRHEQGSACPGILHVGQPGPQYPCPACGASAIQGRRALFMVDHGQEEGEYTCST